MVQKIIYGVKICFPSQIELSQEEKQYDIILRRMIRAALKCEVFVANEGVELEVGTLKFNEMIAIGCLKLL